MDWSWVVVISIQLPRCEGRRSTRVLGWTAAFVGALLCASAFVGTARAGGAVSSGSTPPTGLLSACAPTDGHPASSPTDTSAPRQTRPFRRTPRLRRTRPPPRQTRPFRRTPRLRRTRPPPRQTRPFRRTPRLRRTRPPPRQTRPFRRTPRLRRTRPPPRQTRPFRHTSAATDTSATATDTPSTDTSAATDTSATAKTPPTPPPQIRSAPPICRRRTLQTERRAPQRTAGASVGAPTPADVGTPTEAGASTNTGSGGTEPGSPVGSSVSTDSNGATIVPVMPTSTFVPKTGAVGFVPWAVDCGMILACGFAPLAKAASDLERVLFGQCVAHEATRTMQRGTRPGGGGSGQTDDAPPRPGSPRLPARDPPPGEPAPVLCRGLPALGAFTAGAT